VGQRDRAGRHRYFASKLNFLRGGMISASRRALDDSGTQKVDAPILTPLALLPKVLTAIR
jgi:hypothetical protein